VDAGAIDGSAEQLLEGDEAVAIIEIQAAYLHVDDTARRAGTRIAVKRREIACFRPQSTVTARHTATGKDCKI